MMQRGRRIAFDYGDVRIGVATSDADSIICSPLTTLKSSDKSLLKSISEIFLEIQPIQIFVGRPALLSGKDGAATEKAVAFADVLRGITEIEVIMIDERLSHRECGKEFAGSRQKCKGFKRFNRYGGSCRNSRVCDRS
jgi:putative holliday junction resolvase